MFLGQIVRQQGKRLPFRIRQIAADMNQGVAAHIFIQQHRARGPVARRDVRRDVHAVILRGGDVGAQIAQALAFVTRDDPGHNDVAGVMPGEVIGAIGLQLFTQRLRQRVPETRLERLIVEGQHFDGLFAGHRAIDRAEMITGATRQPQSHQRGGKASDRTHFN